MQEPHPNSPSFPKDAESPGISITISGGAEAGSAFPSTAEIYNRVLVLLFAPNKHKSLLSRSYRPARPGYIEAMPDIVVINFNNQHVKVEVQ